MTGPGAPGSVRLDGVVKTFRTASGSFRAVNDLTLRFEPGESVGVIGANGAGKTTLLRIIAGVTAPSRGLVTRNGRTCAVLELGAGAHPDLSGRENLELLARLAGIGRRTLKRRWQEIVEFSGLGAVLDRELRSYSAGMLARLAFSAIAYSDADILLLDEVLSVGDQEFQFQCRQRIRDISNGGATVVVVSHDLDLVADLCERAVLLEAGRVGFDGAAERAIRRYLGLPDVAHPTGLRAALVRNPVASGQPIEVRLTRPGGTVGAWTVDVQMVIREHPSFLSSGESFSAVFGTTTVELWAPESVIVIPTDGLPPARFELVLTADDAGADGPASAVLPVLVTGPPGPFAIRLPAGLRVIESAGPHPGSP